MKMDDLRVPHDLGNLYVPRPQTAPYCAKLLQAQPLYSQRVSLMTSTSRIALPCRTVGYGRSPCEVNRCIMFHSYVVCMCFVKKNRTLGRKETSGR